MSENYLSLKNALNQAIASDGGLAVFRYYGFEPQNKAQKNNPFRDERTSSFYISRKFGKIIFKDFGDDQIKGDCWKFAQLYEQIDYQQAFKRLCEIYQIFPFDLLPYKFANKQKLKAKKEEVVFEKQLLEIQFKDFTKKELDFWYKKGLITEEVLLANKVKSVSSFKILISEEKSKSYDKLSFIFAYEIIPQKAYKLYMPLPEYRVYSKSKTVFLPSLIPAREHFGGNYSYSFGTDTLTKDKPLILCGGEPDCLALKAAGYNAFTLGDERSTIPDYILQKLKEKNQQISILYDTDYTGLKTSSVLAKKMNCQQLVLPKLKKQNHKNDTKPKLNDVCDYIGLCGFDEDLHLLLNRQIYSNQDYTFGYVPTFRVNKYLSEKKELLANFIRKNKRIQLDADAGIGKTHSLLLEMPYLLNKAILFVVPFAIQVEQIEKEYGEKTKDLVCFTNQSLQNADDEEQAIMARKTGKVNVCTFDRIKTVYERLQADYQDNIIVVVDESHLLTSEYAYRTGAIHDVLEICTKASQIVYLSATPDYSLCKFSAFKLIRFKRFINPKINITALDYAGEPKKALLSLLLNDLCLLPINQSARQQEEQQITIVRLNNKTLAKIIAELLIDKGLYQKDEIDFVFSEKRKGADSKTKESIVNEALIPKNIKLLFVTACFDCGINIQNTNIAKIINFETRYTDNCKDTFKQLIARFRNLDTIQVWVCKPERYKNLPELKLKTTLYKHLLRDAQNKLNLLPYNDLRYCQKIDTQLLDIQNYGLNSPKTPRYIKANQDISAIHKLIFKNKESGNYTINHNYIRFMLKEYERKNLNSDIYYKNLCEELPNTKIIQRTCLSADSKDKNSIQLKELLNREKDLKKERIRIICSLIEKNPHQFFDSVHAAYRDASLKEKIKKSFAVSKPKEAIKIEHLFEQYFNHSLNQSPLTHHSISKHQFPISHYDEEVVELSHRYFYLQEMLIPASKIPFLLENYADDVNFGILTKTLTNHINLQVKNRVGEDVNKIITDSCKLEDTHWIELLIDSAKDFKSKTYQQKRSPQLWAKIQSLQYDLKLLEYEKSNLIGIWLYYLIKIKESEKNKSQLRTVKRKLKSLNNRITRCRENIQDTHNKYQQSLSIGLEINELSEQINRLKPHFCDRQGLTANIRLFASLFKVKIQKKLIRIETKEGKVEFIEKYIAEIGDLLSFEEVLKKFSFDKDEAKNYLDYLDYQIDMDLESNRQILSKNSQNSLTSPIHEFMSISDSIERKVFHNNSRFLYQSKMEYPANWDMD